MNLEGRELFEKAADLEKTGTPFMMCSIVRTEGSTPRKGGTHMIVTADGETFGTVGGGSVEHRSIDHACKMLKDAASDDRDPGSSRCGQARTFDLHKEGGAGAVCGGKVTVLFWQQGAGFFARLSALYDERRIGWLVLDYKGADDAAGTVSAGAYAHDELPAEYGDLAGLVPMMGDCVYTEPLIGAETAWLIGGGHVGQALVPVLHAAGFHVNVVDDRGFVLEMKDELFKDAEEVICCSYPTLAEHISITEKDYVVVTTFGHLGDLETLRAVLPACPKYLGCIGSKKKAAYIRERLEEFGFTAEEIGSIHSPIGLSIGAETPQEIAVSIAAEMIACRRLGDVRKTEH